MEQNNELRLLDKRKKGILRFLFSRFGMTMLLILLEILVLLYIYKWFYDYVRLFAVVQYIFSFFMILYIFNSDMEGTSKLTWLYLTMLFPVPATIVLLASKFDLGHRIVTGKLNEINKETKGIIKQNESVLEREEVINSGTDDLCRYLNRTGTFPLYENTDVTYCENGEIKFKRLMDELAKAESFIFLEYFIIEEGYMWGNVLKLLAKKAEEGVDVRVMYDGMCEAKLLTHDYPKRMEALGIKCKPFTPIKPFISTQYNYRDHRKILVIDGRVAFTGGINLADEYMNIKERFGYWKDSSIMLKGAAVESFTLMFLEMWNLDEKEHDFKEVFTEKPPVKAEGFVMPYCDSPLDNEKVAENVYIDILYKAKDYVHIMTPYLIIDDAMENAIKYAAKRGVDVKIILPGIPDKKGAFSLAKTYYKRLIDAGVKVYEFEPGFVHSKVFVSDDEKVVVGTINLDYRSLYHNFECAAYLYKTACIKDISEDFQNTLINCREITQESVRKEKLLYKLLGMFIKVYEVLM